MKIVTTVIAGLCGAVIAAAALDALAQFPGGSRGRMGGGGPPSAGMPRGERFAGAADISELIEFRLQSLQEDLRLSPGQERVWEPYADRVRALAADIVRERSRARTGEQQTAPQQVDHALDVARNRLTALEDIAVSAKALYAALLPEQRLLADSRFATIVPVIAGTSQASAAPDPMSRSRPGPDGGYGRPPRDRDTGGQR